MSSTIMECASPQQCPIATSTGVSPAIQTLPVGFVNSVTISNKMGFATLIMELSKCTQEKTQVSNIIVSLALQDTPANSVNQATWFLLLTPALRSPVLSAMLITVQLALMQLPVLCVRMVSIPTQLENVLNTNAALNTVVNAQIILLVQLVCLPISWSTILVCGSHTHAMLKTALSACLALKTVSSATKAMSLPDPPRLALLVFESRSLHRTQQ